MSNENLLPKGKHKARARDWTLGEAGTGTKQVGVDFDLVDRAGESVPWYGYISEKALESTVKALRAMGWAGIDLSELAERGGGLDANEVVLVVEHEPEVDSNGAALYDEQGEMQMRARVRWVNAAGGVAMKKTLEGNDLKTFGAEMKARILALDPGAAKRGAPSARPQAAKPAPAGNVGQQGPSAGPNGEDIPF